MGSTSPLVSVAMLAYNQEPFLRESIRSVLAQTLTDLELVVLDNGSSDATAAAVAEFADPRLVYVRLEQNLGPGGGVNRALAACRGRFVALATGDDLSHPRRLEAQLAAFERSGGVVFSNVDYIDDDGAPLSAGHYPANHFAIPPMSRGEVLARFFRTGNFIATVSTFAEREALLAAGPFDPLLYQLQDYELLVRLVKRHPFTFLPDPLVSWRILRGGGNLSSPTPARRVRIMTEQYLVFRRFFDDTPAELFREAFGTQLVNPDSRTPAELACEQAFLLLRHPHFRLAQLLGLERLHGLLSDPQSAAVLAERFGYTPDRYVADLLTTDVLGLAEPYRSYMLVDTGSGVHPDLAAETTFADAGDSFSLTFDLSRFGPVRGLRWDVMRMRACDVRLTAVRWRDADGVAHELDVARAFTPYGRQTGPGAFEFDCLFPMVYLPVEGAVRSVTVEGAWAVRGREESAWRVGERLRERNESAAALASEVATLREAAEAARQAAGDADRRAGSLAGELEALRQGPLTSTLFVDTGTGFRPEQARSARLPAGPGRFRLTFPVGGPPARGLRWDPVELRTCRVRLDAVEWEGADGEVRRLDPAAVTSNGSAAGGVVAFDSLDPMAFLPVEGAVRRVTLTGWYEADDVATSLARAEAAGRAERDRADRLGRQLRDRDDQVRALDERVRELTLRVRSLTAGVDRLPAAG